MRSPTLAFFSSLTLLVVGSLPFGAHAFALPKTARLQHDSVVLGGTNEKVVRINEKKKHGGSGLTPSIGIGIDIGKVFGQGGKTEPSRKSERRRTSKKKEVPGDTTSKTSRAKKSPETVRRQPTNSSQTSAASGRTKCEDTFSRLLSNSDYLRDKASFAESEAEMLRKWVKRWRDISKQAADGAKAAGENGLISSRDFQNHKAAELEDRAQDYENRANAKENEATQLRRQADTEEAALTKLLEEGCHKAAENPSQVSAPPEPDASTPKAGEATPPEPLHRVCGPDITDNVFGVLDKMHRDWANWSEDKRTQKCRALISPLTALSAWDIVELAPGKGFPTRSEYQAERGSDAGYDRFIKWAKFRFEEQAPMCGKPREQCANTVTFLGNCIDPQIVNYVQWGSMSALCDYSALTSSAHAARATIRRTPDDIYTGQRAMAIIGSDYTRTTARGEFFDKPEEYLSADPGAWPAELEALRNKVRSQMQAKLDKLMSSPEYAPFLKHSASTCSTPCPITPDAKKNIGNMTFDYKWNN